MKLSAIVAGKRGESGTYFVRFDDGPEVTFAYNLTSDDTRLDRFDLDWPLDAKTITVRRDANIKGKAMRGEVTAPIFDLAPYTDVLWREELSFCRRILMLNRHIGQATTPSEPDKYGDRAKPRGVFSPYRLWREDRWIQPMNDIAQAHGVQVPAALASFSKLNIEPDMGGGVWCGPCARIITDGEPQYAQMPNVVMAKAKGADWAGYSPAKLDVVLSIYDRAITVAADANHFSGVIWDPVGLNEQEIEVMNGRKDGNRIGPDGTFWDVKDDNWRFLKVIRDETGAIATADYVIRKVFMQYFLKNIGEVFINEEMATEDTVFVDSNAMSPEIRLGDPNAWHPIQYELYQS